MNLTVRKKGNTTITIGKDTHKALCFLKIKTDAKSFDKIIRDLIQNDAK